MSHGMTVDEVLRRRWRATGLPTSTRGAAATTAGEEVRRLGAVQAQEFETTLWSLGRRTGESRDSIVARFDQGEFVRTHALRQTWHFVHRDELTAVQSATAHRVHRLSSSLYRQLGLDDATLRRAGDVVVAALAGGPLSRSAVGARLAADGIEATGLRLGVLMMWAELECIVVSGPLEGKRQTYVLWPDRAVPDRWEATLRLARNFLASHGPATVDDLASWASMTRGQARDAIADLPVERVEVEGLELLCLGDAGADAWSSPQVELLNGYDEYVSGLSPGGKRWLDMGGLRRDRLGAPIGLVVVDGQLAGHWRRSADRSRVAVEAVLLRSFSSAELDALERQVVAYGDFLGVGAGALRLTRS